MLHIGHNLGSHHPAGTAQQLICQRVNMSSKGCAHGVEASISTWGKTFRLLLLYGLKIRFSSFPFTFTSSVWTLDQVERTSFRFGVLAILNFLVSSSEKVK